MSSIDNTTLRIIDPSFDKSNFRAEFRLPTDSVLLSNFRLVNIGISSNQTDSYSPTLGAQGAISAIHLYDGGQLLDTVRDFNTYASFKNINKTNDANISQNRRLNYVGLGFVQDGVQSATADVLDKNDYTLTAQDPVADNLTKQGWLSLQNCFSFLRASMVVPTSLFRQLRVVVQYKSAEALKNAVRDRRDGTLTTDTGTALLCEEVAEGPVKVEMARRYEGVVYRPIEFDSVQIPAVPDLAATNDATKVIAQNNNFILHGFNNKKLHRILVVKKPTQEDTWVNGNVNKGYGNNGSEAQWLENLQVRVNGANKLAGSGLSGKNKRLAMLTDVWGDCNVINGQQFVQTGKFNNYVSGVNTLQATQGSVDYAALIIEEYITNLQIFLDRSGVYDNPRLAQVLDVIVMGETERAVIPDNQGGYKLIYTQ